VPPLPPRRSRVSLQPACATRCCLHPLVVGSASGALHFRGHLCVRLRCGPVTRSHPHDDLVDGLQVIGFPPPCHPSYKASGFYLGGTAFPPNAPAFAGRTTRAERAVFASHPQAALLRTNPLASKPVHIRAFLAFYQIGSSLRKRKSGLMCFGSTFLQKGQLERGVPGNDFPQYYRTISEFAQPLLDTASVLSIALASASSRARPASSLCSYAAEFREHRDAQRFAHEYIPTLRSWTESTFLRALSQSRPLDERRAIIDRSMVPMRR
jgi:hypothetical protein